MKTILCIVGLTCSGKNTVAMYLKDKYDINTVCSYTTRPIRSNETNGIEHYFISDEAMNILELRNDIIAKVTFPKTGYRYCTTLDSLSENITSFVIEPSGVEYIKNNFPDIRIISVYVNISLDILEARVKSRGDNWTDFDNRLTGEFSMFEKFRLNEEYDYLVNNFDSLESLYISVDLIMEDVGELNV